MKSLFAKIFIVFILLQGCDSTSVPVKKSKTNICHKKGSKYYDQTKHFKMKVFHRFSTWGRVWGWYNAWYCVGKIQCAILAFKKI